MRLFARHRAEMPSRAQSPAAVGQPAAGAAVAAHLWRSSVFVHQSAQHQKDTVRSLEIRNIYTKLGINSLKQLQQCIAVLHSDGTGTALPEPPHEAAEPENKEDELPMTD